MPLNLSTLCVKLLHVVLRLLFTLGLILALLLCAAAYGIPGKWLQETIDAQLPEEARGALTLGHIAFRPGAGLVLRHFTLKHPKTHKTLVSIDRAKVGIRLLTKAPLQERLKALDLHKLYVAQIEYDPNRPADTLDTPHDPFPDLTFIKLPRLHNVRLHLTEPDVLEVRLKEIWGLLSTDTEKGILRFHNLKGDIDGDDETAEADLDVDLYDAKVSAHIRGFIIQTRLNGIYRALDFPIIEEYSNKFTLRAPAWGDCTFTVGFDKYRNLFDLTVNIVSRKGGAYCGVPFDEAQGTIHCHGIWDAVTEITPIIARRNGKIAATGSLRFDCPKDRFTFKAKGNGLMPDEALRLVDMPFTDVIPKMTCPVPPALDIEGSIPLLSEQTPARVILDGTFSAPHGGQFERIPLAAAEGTLQMRDGTFTLKSLHATLPHGGILTGAARFAIPPTADYTDLSADVFARDASLADLLTPFGLNTLTNCVANGSVSIKGRTNETFAQSLNGSFDLKIDGGLIGRLPLFAGLTDLFADYIPGVSAVTDTSTIQLKGLARNGIISTPKLSLTGDLFSIEGPVSYDLPNDNLNALVIAGVFKKESWAGTLTRWAAVPMNRLLWQVQVTGPIANPHWKLITIVNRLWNGATGQSLNEPTVLKEETPAPASEAAPEEKKEEPGAVRAILGTITDGIGTGINAGINGIGTGINAGINGIKAITPGMGNNKAEEQQPK